jgi:hypothetical protein
MVMTSEIVNSDTTSTEEQTNKNQIEKDMLDFGKKHLEDNPDALNINYDKEGKPCYEVKGTPNFLEYTQTSGRFARIIYAKDGVWVASGDMNNGVPADKFGQASLF